MEASRSSSRRAAEAGAAVGRRALLLLCPATFFQGYDDLVLGLSLPLLAREFGLSASEAGLAVSAIQAGSFGLLLLLPLADRVGRRPLLLWTIVGYTVATAATALSRSVADLVAFQFAARVCLGTEYALALIAVVELIPADRRGRALGLVTSMSALGMAGAGAAFLVVATLDLSWRVLYAVGALPLAVVAVARRLLPETLPARDPSGHAGAMDAAGSTVAPTPGGSRLRDLPRALAAEGVRTRSALAAAVLSLLFSVYPTALTTFATLLVLREWGLEVRSLSPVQVAAWVSGVSGFFVAGRLADRVGRRTTAIGFLAGAALAGVVTFPAEGAWLRTVGLAVVIFGLTGSTPLVSALTTEPFPAAVRARVGAVARAAGLLGGTLAPGITGAIAAVAGGIGPALSLVGLSYLLAVPAVLALSEGSRSGAGEPIEGRGVA